MAENCAGCGHSHDLSGGRFGPTLACWEPPFGSCKCPGYRTHGQLDAAARIEELEKGLRAILVPMDAALKSADWENGGTGTIWADEVLHWRAHLGAALGGEE